MKTLYSIGHYCLFMKGLFLKPEKFSVYLRQITMEMIDIGYGSLGISVLISVFMGAVLTIQSVHNLVSPLVPIYAIAIVTRDAVILEFSPTVVSLVLAGKVGSSIASQLGTMRVTEQIDALEIMGINSSGYLVLPKIIAAILILPFLITITMFVGIGGGWAAGAVTGLINSHEFRRGLLSGFDTFNVTFALIKVVVFAFTITSVSSYHGYYTQGGALEVGQSSTKAVVWSSVLILFLDYVLTQLLLI
ncbi:MAG: ABC transporter permease [Bacteroidota bacterium]